ncbi:LysR family transcriptional regulator [Aurantiacibacter sp. MUD11]|uniref:LysR family transcriptional regulator n=1 Tax=Aurantiacibacter sp. MUD11 TaxID=3003265 RepID=UPI0022AB0927|nr:LysR family transcriptional regulator [Aurantiacibacter sp. MUD11]WAT17473.1 LysR family transcriptional regulator [Aurantiacibacter sp. MUD11]
MPNLPFTLRQLEVFASLAESGSFRRTAEALGISQASVSNQVKVLEEQLGVRLFDRRPGLKPLLTVEGQSFLEDYQAFELAALRLASHRKSNPETDEPVRYRILIGQGMFDGYIRPKMDLFFADNPLVELEMEAMPPSSGLIRALETGRFDFALLNMRTDQPYDSNSLRRLSKVKGGIFGHRKHAQGRSLPLSADEINLLPFVLPSVGSRQERELLQALDTFGVRPRKVVCHTQYYDVMATMLERGLAVASFSEAVLPVTMRENVVQLMPVEDWYLLFYRKDEQPDARRQAVEHFLISSILDDPNYPALAIY